MRMWFSAAEGVLDPVEEVGLKNVSNLKWQKREEGTVRPKGSEFSLQLRHLHSQRRRMLGLAISASSWL